MRVKTTGRRRRAWMVGAGVAGAVGLAGSAWAQPVALSEGFDSYATWQPLVPQGGWETWRDYFTGLSSPDGRVSGQQFVSFPNSLELSPTTDVIRRLGDQSSGKWTLTMRVRVLTSVGTNTTVSILNRYEPSVPPGQNGSYEWTSQVGFVADQILPPSGRVVDLFDPMSPSLPLPFDEWRELRYDLDLDAGTVTKYYGGQPLGEPRQAFEPAFPGFGTAGPQRRLGALDFLAGPAPTTGSYAFYVDDIVLRQVEAFDCYANCDGSTIQPILNPLDFSCFLVRFRSGDGYANCDGSTIQPVLNPLDFSCFLSRFKAGCS